MRSDLSATGLAGAAPSRSRWFWAVLLGLAAAVALSGLLASRLERSAAIARLSARLAAPERSAADGTAAAQPELPLPPLGVSARQRRGQVAEAASKFSPGARMRRRQVFAAEPEDVGFIRLDEPASGEWLASFPEPGETAREYRRRVRAGLGRGRGFQLQPLGDLQPSHRALLPVLRSYVELFFGAEVELLAVRPLPESSYVERRRQHDAGVIATALAERVPRRSLGVFALLSADLFYTPSLNFVFGIGDADQRVGVQSLYRFGSEPRLLRRRALLLVSHELGHMLGLAHCVFYECAMNGVNSLAEADGKPLALCPECRAKLEHALGLERQSRYRKLADFYRRHGLASDAALATALANRTD